MGVKLQEYRHGYTRGGKVTQILRKIPDRPDEYSSRVYDANDLGPWYENGNYYKSGEESPRDIVELLPQGINDLAFDIHDANKEAGWWDNPREVGTILMLCVSELAEDMEGDRKSLQDDHLPHRSMLEVELADTVIRILDFAAYKKFDLEGAINEKLEYNRTRKDHSREARAAEGGKAY